MRTVIFIVIIHIWAELNRKHSWHCFQLRCNIQRCVNNAQTTYATSKDKYKRKKRPIRTSTIETLMSSPSSLSSPCVTSWGWLQSEETLYFSSGPSIKCLSFLPPYSAISFIPSAKKNTRQHFKLFIQFFLQPIRVCSLAALHALYKFGA